MAMKKLIFWWLFGLATASAQQLPLKQYTVSDGLAQSQVGSLHQDHNGYLWIATRAGLSRFDGNSFVNHTVATGLPGHWVLEISESGNDIWGRTPSHFFRVLGDSIAAFSEQPDSLLYPGTLLATGSGEDAVVILSQKDNRLHLTRIAHEKSGKMRSSHTEQRKVKALARMRWDARSNGFLIQDSSGGLFFLNEKEILPVQHPNPLLICGQDFENPSRVLVHDILTGSLFKHESGDLIELNVKVDPRTLCNQIGRASCRERV